MRFKFSLASVVAGAYTLQFLVVGAAPIYNVQRPFISPGPAVLSMSVPSGGGITETVSPGRVATITLSGRDKFGNAAPLTTTAVLGATFTTTFRLRVQVRPSTGKRRRSFSDEMRRNGN